MTEQQQYIKHSGLNVVSLALGPSSIYSFTHVWDWCKIHKKAHHEFDHGIYRLNDTLEWDFTIRY